MTMPHAAQATSGPAAPQPAERLEQASGNRTAEGTQGTLAPHLSAALAALEAGDPARALQVLKEGAATDGGPQRALLAGLIHERAGDRAAALQCFKQATVLAPQSSTAWLLLGRALRAEKELEAAVQALERAAQLQPTADALSMLSNALRELGHLTQAATVAASALAREPCHPEAHLNAGAAHHLLGHTERAALHYAAALTQPTTRAAASHNLSALLRALDPALAGQPMYRAVAALDHASPEEALRALVALAEHHRCVPVGLMLGARLLALNPTAQDYLGQAELLWKIGQRASAEQVLGEAVRRYPEESLLYRRFAAWFCSGAERPSLPWTQWLEACPPDAVALAKLGGLAQRTGLPVRAAKCYERLVALRPEVAESHYYSGMALTEQGEYEQAAQAFTRALALSPNRPDIASSLLFCKHLDPSISAPALFREHRLFGERLENRSQRRARRSGPLGKHQRLRIGYISPDLCAHPVSYFLEPVLRAHDRTRFEVHCFANLARADQVTERLAALSDSFTQIHGWSDAELADRLEQSSIDILVDLAGHTAGNRLPVFALRPCRVQASWLGYFNTTGLASMDYRIADVHSTPPQLDRWYTESVVRLPRSANCYEPPGAVAIAPPPCLHSAHVTFGCLNNPAKLNRASAALFARILRECPDSKLLFKYRSWNDAALRARHLGWLEAHGIPPSRVQFEGSEPIREFLASLSKVDIALDTFPYSGETTALHCLWMGVPVVAIEGATTVERLASRVLRVSELHQWVARSQDEYLAIACRLASSRVELEHWRGALRRQLQASPLLDHVGITRDLEQAYRSMWQQRSQ